MSFMSNFVGDWRAHPFQSILSTIAGAFIPGGGFGAHALFNAYNNHQFNNAYNTSMSNQQAEGDAAAQAGFDRPLNGSLALVTGMPGAYGAPDFGGGNSVSGSGGSYDFGGGINYGGATPSNGLFDQVQNTANNGLFDFGSNNSMFVPDYGMAGDVASGVYNHASPQARRDYRDGLAMNGSGTPGNYGVSNFMVGGSPVIFGAGDPNGRYRNRGYEYGG